MAWAPAPQPVHPEPPPYVAPGVGGLLPLGLGQQLLVGGRERPADVPQQSAGVLQGGQRVRGHPTLHCLVDGQHGGVDWEGAGGEVSGAPTGPGRHRAPAGRGA